MCTSTGSRPKTRVLLNASAPVERLAYFTGCDGADQNQYGFYDLHSAQNPGRRLLQQPKPKASLLQRADIQRLAALQPTPKPAAFQDLALRPGLASLRPALQTPILPGFSPFTPKEPSANDLCFEQPINDKTSAPESCSAGTPKFVLTKEWLQMNNLAQDAADPCAKYQSPVGYHGVQCVNV